MEKKSPSPIPVIDLQELAIGQQELKKLKEACEDWGCFRLINHKIPLTSMAEMKSVARSLLDLPTEIKRRNTDVILGSGYAGPSEASPLFEALGLYDVSSSQAHHTFCSQLDASTHQREVIEKYTKGAYHLSMELAGKLAESLGLAGGGEAFKGWPCLFKINKYNFSPQSVGSTGVGLHTDSGFLTILQDDENVGGLEVMDKFGHFVAVDPLPGTFLVNLGDAAKAWSNGRLCNVKHRVKCKEGSIRISMGTFLFPSMSNQMEPPPEFVDAEHPRLYNPFFLDDYRKLRLSSKLSAGEALDLLRVQS